MSGLALSATEQRFCELVRRLAPRPASTCRLALQELDQQLRFRADVGYANPGREVVRVQRVRGKAELTVNRYVLAGLFGPLPEPYQELAVRRDAAGDSATRAFLDLFNHRVNLLRFWILSRNQPGLAALEPSQTALVRLAVGVATGACPSASAGAPADTFASSTRLAPLSASCLTGLSGLLRHPHRSLAVIQAVLRRVLPYPLRVLPFAGGWVRRRVESYSRLGSDSCRLTRSAILGTRVWDTGKGIELRLHCALDSSLRAILPGGAEHASLCHLLRWVTQGRVDIHVSCSVPSSVFGSALTQERAPRLGYTSRLSGRAAQTRPVRFLIQAAEPPHRGVDVH